MGMTVEQAIRILLYEEYLEDYIYNVRDSASEDRAEEDAYTNSWELPRVVRFSEICKVLKKAYPKVDPPVGD